ncbi:uncharacterized protein PHACADRAFT_262128 [Phanerochaete carnosa HHB-10118-sp]|uniref:DUF6534 domain-containing protein n=1 Tax=Phanerochaete carnosa (strain HHB-10118-sp) TaxID=650164 RepID=K5WNB2_PHACS|nr:uncharacterized protein PHACADRAFT_262128 [Phanerochaete carnosa HHB-10118-sp]EKM51787.1 hypothetical protein PHACADRAFT_262128 [Phanerochaete carnosa HHB-10118-sp]
MSGPSTINAASASVLDSALAVSKDSTYGAAFVGMAASSALFGIVCSQMFTYLRRYPLDRPFYKILVALLWLIEAVDQAFIAHAAYYYTVSNWGNPVVLIAAPVWSLVVQVLLGAVAGAIVKICFAMRVWRFSGGNRPVTGMILALAVAQLAAACVYTERGLKIASLLEIDSLKVVGSLSLGLGMATDIVTAASLCWFLQGLRTGYSKDDSLVNTLSLYAVNTGVLTSAVSLSTMILYNIMPSNFIFIALYFVLSKLYVNSFLATLNTRRVLRGRGTDAETNTMPTFLMVGKLTRHENHPDTMHHAYPPSAAHSWTSRSKQDLLRSQTSALEVEIEQEVTVTRDSVRYGVAV